MILPYKLDTTNDLLTSRGGLLSIAQLMESVNLAERIDQHFPQPKSNRGYQPSEFIKTLILMQHEGSFHLDDIRIFRKMKRYVRYWISKLSPKQPLLAIG